MKVEDKYSLAGAAPARNESNRVPDSGGKRLRWWCAIALLSAALCVDLLFYPTTNTAPEGTRASDEEILADFVSGKDTGPSIAQLEAQLARAPRDGRAWVLLARRHFESDRYDAAARAYEKALAVSPKVARDPLVWCEFADALGMAQGGTLVGKPRELISIALSINGNHPRALEMAGSAEYEAGNYARALGYWEPLLSQLRPGSAARQELDIAIARVRQLSGAGESGRTD